MYTTLFTITYMTWSQLVAKPTMESGYYIQVVWFTFGSNLAVPNHEIDKDCI